MFFTGFKVAVKLKFIVSRNGRSTTRNGDFIGKDTQFIWYIPNFQVVFEFEKIGISKF